MPHTITLRKSTLEDLEFFFQFQLDEEANYMAAFTAKDPSDKKAYIEKYSKILQDADKNTQTILYNNTIVGSISKFVMEGDNEITYWIDKHTGAKELRAKHWNCFYK